MGKENIMKKKLLSAILILVFALTMTACGGDNNTEGTAGET